MGGRAIHYTNMQRKKPQASNGRPLAAEAANYRHNHRVVPPEPSLSGSALGLWGQRPVQHALYRPVAIASPAVSLRGGLQSSSSSPPSISYCHAAIGRLKRAAHPQQTDFSACCQLSYHQQCLPSCSCCISDSSAKAPYAFSEHH